MMTASQFRLGFDIGGVVAVEVAMPLVPIVQVSLDPGGAVRRM